MQEYILAAVVRGDKSVSAYVIEQQNPACGQESFFH
jgi:hypothetical protein